MTVDIANFHTDHAGESHGGFHCYSGVISRGEDQRQGTLVGQILGYMLALLKQVGAYPLIALPRTHQRRT